MELWDLYNKYREKTGEEHIRGNALPKGRYHLAVHVWIKNKKGQYVISKRAANRPTFPNMWECVGGSVLKGESSLQGALREVKEEVGITLHPGQGHVVFSKQRNEIDGIRFQDYMDVWLFEYDGEITISKATTDEVSECRWMYPEEIKELFEAGKFVKNLDYFFSAFPEQKMDYGDVIGKKVQGTVDRPAGTRHPRHKDMIYPINYGFVDGVFAGDGAEQDVYIFGTKEPLTHFTGTVIGVFHRFNDVEDKWIVSLEGKPVDENVILGDIAFQEQFFYGKLYV